MPETLDDPKIRRIYERLIKLIYIRPRSIKEATDFLKKALKNNQEPDNSTIINVLIERLVKLKYLNDSDFAKWWIDQRVGHKSTKSKLAITNELRNKGVANDVIENTINKFNFTEIESIAIEKEIDKKLKTLLRKTNDRRILKAKLFSYLKQKGFNLAELSKLIDRKLS